MNNNNKRVCLYLCECYKKGDRKERIQIIVYPDGRVMVGYDVFRLLNKVLLNKVDYPSYPIYHYQSLKHLIRDYILKANIFISHKKEDLVMDYEKWELDYVLDDANLGL